jgi:lipid-binding SYLF domain-containing protein
MKKKICLSFAVICSMSLFATSALADSAGPSCGYDAVRAAQLKVKGAEREVAAKAIVEKMMARYQEASSAPEVKSDSKVGGFESAVKRDDKMMPEVLPAMLRDADKCMVVIPSEKTVDILIPFFTGVNYGRGVEYCKNSKGQFDLDHPSSYVQIEGLDAGLGWGIQSTDLVLAVSKDNKDNRKLMLSADASASLGGFEGLPGGGRDISVGLDSDGKSVKPAITVSYSSSKGFLAAATLDYSNFSPDKTMNAAMDNKPLPKENFLMRLFHSSARKKADAACAQKDQALATAQAAPGLEDATVASVIPTEAAPQLVVSAAVANAPLDDSKGLNPEAQASADTTSALAAQAAASAQAGATLDAQIRNAPDLPLSGI